MISGGVRAIERAGTNEISNLKKNATAQDAAHQFIIGRDDDITAIYSTNGPDRVLNSNLSEIDGLEFENRFGHGIKNHFTTGQCLRPLR